MSFVDETAIGQTEGAIFDAATDIPAPDATLPTIGEEDTEEVPFFDSFKAGFMDAGYGVGATQIDGSFDNITDSNFRLSEFANENPELMAIFDKYRENPDDPASQSVLSALVNTKNATQVAELATRLQDREDRQEQFGANPVAGIMGMVSSIGLDLAMLGLGPGSALRSAKGLINTVRSVKSLSASLRTGTALRSGTVAGGAAWGEMYVHSISNPLITDDDLVIAAVLGAGIGGGLGALFPRAVGRADVVLKELSDDVPKITRSADDIMKEAYEYKPTSAGAGAAPAEVIPVPGKGASGFGVAKNIFALPGIRSLRLERWLRSPRNVMRDWGLRGKKDFAASKLEGYRTAYAELSKILHMSTANEAEITGTAARAMSAEQHLSNLSAARALTDELTTQNYRNLMEGVYDMADNRINAAKEKFRNSAWAELPMFKSNRVRIIEMERMADEYSIARATREGGVEDIGEFIPEHIKRRHSPEQIEAMKGFISRQADIDDEFYQRMGQVEVDVGLLQPEELIPGYRPQRWNIQAINGNTVRFDMFLMKVFAEEPDINWLKKHVTIENEDGTVVPWETWDEIKELAPREAQEALEEWGAATRAKMVEKRDEVWDLRDQELKKLRLSSMQELDEVFEKRVANTRKAIARWEKRYNEADTSAKREEASVELGKLEKKIVDAETEFSWARKLDREGAEADDFIKKHGKRKSKKALKKSQFKVKMAEKSAMRAQASKTMQEQIQQIRESIVSNAGSPTGYVPDEFTTFSQRLMRRQINLGEQRFTEDARFFLDSNAGGARESYDASVSPQIALRRVKPQEAGETQSQYQQRWLNDTVAGFEKDARLRGVEAPSAEKERLQTFTSEILKEFTRTTERGGDVARAVGSGARLGTSITATALLGGVAIAQLADLAILALSGGRLGTGLKQMFTGRAAKIIRELDDREMAVFLQGQNTMDASRFRNLYDYDGDLAQPGTKLQRIQRMVDEVGVVQGWANLMHVWNRQVRGSFGLGFAHQIDKTLGNWNGLEEGLKRFYRKHGIDEQTAREIKEMLDANHTTTSNGIRVPNTKEWHKTTRGQHLLSKYTAAMKSAGDEALLDPGVGDRPFLRATPFGRVILQFQSFTFRAGHAFIPVLAQEARINPMQARVLGAMVMTVGMSALSTAGQAYRYNRLEEWLNNWNDDEGTRDNLWELWMRSPMVAGASSVLMELYQSQYGQGTNDAIEGVTGLRPLKEDQTKFRQMQGIFPLFGALSGLTNSTVQAVGDYDKTMALLNKRIPVWNVFYLQMIRNMMGEE